MFHAPVATSTAYATHATRLNPRATSRGASGEIPRRVGTSAPRVIWPPTHTVAARMCRLMRNVSQDTLTTGVHSAGRARPARHPGPAG